jgi:hypothetical protein
MLELTPSTLDRCRAMASTVVNYCWSGEIRHGDTADEQMIAAIPSSLTAASERPIRIPRSNGSPVPHGDLFEDDSVARRAAKLITGTGIGSPSDPPWGLASAQLAA